MSDSNAQSIILSDGTQSARPDGTETSTVTNSASHDIPDVKPTSKIFRIEMQKREVRQQQNYILLYFVVCFKASHLKVRVLKHVILPYKHTYVFIMCFFSRTFTQ